MMHSKYKVHHWDEQSYEYLTFKIFTAKWSLKANNTSKWHDTNLDFWIHYRLCVGVSNSNDSHWVVLPHHSKI